MKHDILAAAALLSNADLLARLQQLAEGARENTVEMVAHLAELEARGSYLADGYGSLFDYCHLALRLSEHAAYNRVVAARVVRRFPSILAGLADGSLNLTTVRVVASHLTADNHCEVLAHAAGRSKRETEALVAGLAPQPDVVSSVRKMPAVHPRALQAPPHPSSPAAAKGADVSPVAATPLGVRFAPLAVVGAPVAVVEASVVDAGRTVAPLPAPRPVLAPLSPGRYRVQFTVDAETYHGLRWLQDLLRREIPDGDPGTIFTRALQMLLAQVAKEKTAATPTPGPESSAAFGSRHIPASVKRAVWLRDRGQCHFVARHGRRCAQRAFLEFHHIRPFALGGEATIDNISLRCRRHNAHEATLVFGSDVAKSPAGTNAPGRVG